MLFFSTKFIFVAIVSWSAHTHTHTHVVQLFMGHHGPIFPILKSAYTLTPCMVDLEAMSNSACYSGKYRRTKKQKNNDMIDAYEKKNHLMNDATFIFQCVIPLHAWQRKDCFRCVILIISLHRNISRKIRSYQVVFCTKASVCR